MSKSLTSAESSRDLWIVRTFHEFGNNSKEVYSWHYDDEAFTRCRTRSPFRESQNRFYRIVGSCNGVICLADDRPKNMKDLTLWNPTIQWWLSLPPADSLEQAERSLRGTSGTVKIEQIIGFGYDTESNEHKVIKIVYLNEALPKLVLYVVDCGKWKDISHLGDQLKDLIIMGETQVILKGDAHWIAKNKETDCVVILCFDMGKEEFHCIETPTVLPFASPIVIEGMLSVVAVDSFMEKCCIWKMTKYGDASSWEKYLVIDRAFDSVVGFRSNGELLVDCSGCLHSYHPQTKMLTSLDVKSCCGYLEKSLHAERFDETHGLLELGIDEEREMESEESGYERGEEPAEENVQG